MMTNQNGGFVRIRIKKSGQPLQLFLADLPFDLVHVAKRVEQDPVGHRGFDETDVFLYHHRFRGFVIGEAFAENSAVIVIPESHVERHSAAGELTDDTDKGVVISMKSFIESDVPVNDNSGDGIFLCSDFGNHLFEIVHHVCSAGLFGRIRINVSVREKRPGLAFRIFGSEGGNRRRNRSDGRRSQKVPAGDGVEMKWHGVSSV